jgi:flagellar hook-associated protein 3 FlgL
MRVTNSSFTDSLVSHLQRLSRRQSELQNQVSTGQRLNSPADDPLAAAEVLRLKDQTSAAGQYQKNIQNQLEYATVSLSSIRSLTKVLDRAMNIAMTTDAFDSKDDMKTFAGEIDQLIKHAVQIGNASHRGEFIFGGTRSDSQPFEAALDESGRVTGVTFSGNTEINQAEIAPGVLVGARAVGENTSGSGERGLLADSRSGADFFGHLIDLRDKLMNGDVAGVAASRELLKQDEENLIFHVGDNASLQSRLEASLQSAKTEKLSLEGEISKRADADLAETIVMLTRTQTNYQAALQSAGAVMNLTLLDFLR